jgi:hypothetical protein
MGWVALGKDTPPFGDRTCLARVYREDIGITPGQDRRALVVVRHQR